MYFNRCPWTGFACEIAVLLGLFVLRARKQLLLGRVYLLKYCHARTVGYLAVRARKRLFSGRGYVRRCRKTRTLGLLEVHPRKHSRFGRVHLQKRCRVRLVGYLAVYAQKRLISGPRIRAQKPQSTNTWDCWFHAHLFLYAYLKQSRCPCLAASVPVFLPREQPFSCAFRKIFNCPDVAAFLPMDSSQLQPFSCTYCK